MLISENLSCVRAGNIIFRHMGFCLQPGALLLLKGPNGSGKTTLLKILAGLLQPDSGGILWDNASIKDNNEFKRDLMFIGHKSGVKSDATVYENLSFWAKLYDTELLIPAALSFYNLNRFSDIPAAHLSAGWQRRIALARLIVSPCKLWLLDEPTNFLDEDAVILTASLIEARVQQGGIVVVASHIMSSAIAAHTLWMGDFAPFASPSGRGRGEGKTTNSNNTGKNPHPNPLPEGEGII